MSNVDPKTRTQSTMTIHLLDNIVWHALTGPHASYASGAGGARRYSPGFSPIVGFVNNERPDFEALNGHCEPGEHLYCVGWSGTAPPGWQVDVDAIMYQMVWQAPMPNPDESIAIVRLGPDHIAQMLDLVALTRPGPFGRRTVELGEYLGFFEGQGLVAMAGERMCAGTLREISGVCTHPDFQSRGLARRLMEKLIRRQILHGETPFLHVMRDNDSACRLYERMGFRRHREYAVRVVSRCP